MWPVGPWPVRCHNLFEDLTDYLLFVELPRKSLWILSPVGSHLVSYSIRNGHANRQRKAAKVVVHSVLLSCFGLNLSLAHLDGTRPAQMHRAAHIEGPTLDVML